MVEYALLLLLGDLVICPDPRSQRQRNAADLSTHYDRDMEPHERTRLASLEPREQDQDRVASLTH